MVARGVRARPRGGSGLSARDVWSFGGTDVAHWNGSAWSRTSVARLLPAALKSHLNDPAVTGVFEQSADSVYATGNGNDEDDGGPMVLLHWDGHRWSKVAGGLFGFGVEGVQPIAPDGRGGLWIPMAGPGGGLNGRMLHYSGGHLTTVAIPGRPSRTSIATVARVPAPPRPWRAASRTRRATRALTTRESCWSTRANGGPGGRAGDRTEVPGARAFVVRSEKNSYCGP